MLPHDAFSDNEAHQGLNTLFDLSVRQGERATRTMQPGPAALARLDRALREQSSLSRLQKAATMPEPPRLKEFYRYFQKERYRKVAALLQFLSMGALYGVWEVCSKSWLWWPFLAILIVLIPWRVFTLIITFQRPLITMHTHTAVMANGWRNRGASVDVFLPIAGESLAVIQNTFKHVQRLAWDGPLRIYVLDDAGDPHARTLAEQFGLRYCTRPDRGNDRKSGNLNYGLTVSDGDFIAIFDADFAPAPNFLTETIPYFLEPTVGIVQTAQYFSTNGRDTRNWLQQLAGSIQSTFYCWTQPARQNSGTAFCVGTNVIYRRTALEEAQGFPLVPVGEDIVTTLRLLAHGYSTMYLPLILARGACPDTFSSAINQQYRWCSSAFNQIGPRIGPAGLVPQTYQRAPLTIKQRIIFGSALLYYLQSALELVAMAAPSLIMMWYYPWQVQPGNYLPIAPAMLGMLAMPYVVEGWRPTMLRLSVVFAASHLIAIVDHFRRNTAAWVPSGARSHKSRVTVTAKVIVRGYVILILGLSWAALARDIPVYTIAAYWASLLLTIIQTVILLPLLLPSFGTMGRIRQMRMNLMRRKFG